MRVHRGSIRDLLQRASLLQMPHEFRPFNPKWKFRKGGVDKRRLQGYIARLRLAADSLEEWLKGAANDQK